MKRPADLPNRSGFRFTGHLKDGTTVQCIVRDVKVSTPDGYVYNTHRAFTLDNHLVYNELAGWSEAEKC